MFLRHFLQEGDILFFGIKCYKMIYPKFLEIADFQYENQPVSATKTYQSTNKMAANDGQLKLTI